MWHAIFISSRTRIDRDLVSGTRIALDDDKLNSVAAEAEAPRRRWHHHEQSDKDEESYDGR